MSRIPTQCSRLIRRCGSTLRHTKSRPHPRRLGGRLIKLCTEWIAICSRLPGRRLAPLAPGGPLQLPYRQGTDHAAAQQIPRPQRHNTLTDVQLRPAEAFAHVCPGYRAREERRSRHLATDRLAELVRRLVRRRAETQQARPTQHSTIVLARVANPRPRMRALAHGKKGTQKLKITANALNATMIPSTAPSRRRHLCR